MLLVITSYSACHVSVFCTESVVVTIDVYKVIIVIGLLGQAEITFEPNICMSIQKKMYVTPVSDSQVVGQIHYNDMCACSTRTGGWKGG